MTYRFHHVHLICSDLEQMERFFTETLGAKFVKRQKFGTGEGALLDFNGAAIYLRMAQEGEQIAGDASEKRYGYDHFGLEVDDIDRAYRELKGRGFLFAVPPESRGTAKIAFFRGPDNITIELLQSTG